MKVIVTFTVSQRTHDAGKRDKHYKREWDCIPREGDSVVIDDICYDVQAVLWDVDRNEVEVRVK